MASWATALTPTSTGPYRSSNEYFTTTTTSPHDRQMAYHFRQPVAGLFTLGKSDKCHKRPGSHRSESGDNNSGVDERFRHGEQSTGDPSGQRAGTWNGDHQFKHPGDHARTVKPVPV